MSLKARLNEIQLKIGNAGIEKLYLEAKKQKVSGITKEAVRLYLATHDSKQILKPLPESKGKTGSEAQHFRVQIYPERL